MFKNKNCLIVTVDNPELFIYFFAFKNQSCLIAMVDTPVLFSRFSRFKNQIYLIAIQDIWGVRCLIWRYLKSV